MSVSVEKKVPEIRFKGFSGEWEKRLLGSLCLIGDIDHRMPESKKTGIPYLMTGDFYGINGLDLNSAKLISIEDYEQLSKKIKPELGDILFARYASVGAVRYVVTDTKFLISYSCAIMKTNNTTYGKYLFYFFQTERTQGQLELDINTGSQRNIGIDSLKSLLVALPKSAEQTAIGNTFQKLDNLIKQHQQKHDQLSNIKKAMLEKMFPKQGETIPEIRFKGFSGEWEEKELNNEVELFSGLTYSPKDIRKEGTFVIRSSNVKKGQLVQADNVYVNSEVVNCSNVIKGDVIVVVRNGSRSLIGKHAQVSSCMENTVIGAFMTGIRGKQPEFINALLDTNQFTAEVEKNLGATINQITNGAFRSMVFMFPTEEEQTAIGNYFQKLDSLIKQHQNQISKLGNIKQACLSKMFV